jgi:hypothetical protein
MYIIKSNVNQRKFSNIKLKYNIFLNYRFNLVSKSISFFWHQKYCYDTLVSLEVYLLFLY